MPPLHRTVGVAVDLAGCPNRCRHCYLGVAPNKRLPAEFLTEVANAFWNWRRPGETAPFFEQVDVKSWYREPDFRDDYRELYDLEAELSRRAPRRWELLSVWRLARDPSYARWAKERGPRVCQITFFGGRETTDWFCRRRGVFDDNLAATERLLDAGMIPRWQIILTKRALPDLPAIVSLVDTHRLRERVTALGADFDIFCHLPGPDGEAFSLEDIRIEAPDLAAIPSVLMDSTEKHFNGVDWQTESAIIENTVSGREIPAYVPDEQWFFVNSEYDAFSNYGDLTPAWRLGNLKSDPLDAIVAAFQSDATPAFRAAFHTPAAELAPRFGRKHSLALYSPADLKSRWVRMLIDSSAGRVGAPFSHTSPEILSQRLPRPIQ